MSGLMLETDYLVVGAGASGMAFTDEVIAHSDAQVVLVDRRYRPGGHWNDAYPFARLHQPSAYYGVNSRVLGADAIDEAGSNAGFYERASAAEICDYYQRVLDEELLPSGQVRFFGMCDYVGTSDGQHRLASRLTGETTSVRVRRRLVDATYLQSSVPSTHTPPFDVAPDVRLVAPNGLVDLRQPASGYTVIGAGKTSMDTCNWLLDNGVSSEAIRWIRPRDPWTLDRRFWQPLAQLPWLIEGLSLQFEAAAQAEDIPDLFHRLEAAGQVIRLDPDVEPATFRAAILSAAERDNLRTITNVVRQGRVVRLTSDRIALERTTIRTDPDHVHVDCTATGLNQAPPRPVFTPDRITPQWLQWGVFCFSAALIGFVEVSGRNDEDKNRLCPPSPPLNEPADWAQAFHTSMRAQSRWRQEPDIATWTQHSRLNPLQGIEEHGQGPRMQSARTRLANNRERAETNLQQLLGDSEQPAPT